MIRARTLLLTVGGVLGVAAGGMLLALVTALMYGGEDTYALLVATVVTSVGGALSWTIGSKWRKKKRAPAKAAFLVVSVGWLVMSGVGAMPYWLYAHLPRPFNSARAQKGGHTGGLPITRCVPGERAIGYEFCSLTNCLFESASGFTTTGASIVTVGLWERPESRSGLPRGILMWRAVTQWLGGMGIVLLALALFPFLGIGGYSLYRAEVPGPTKEKLTPRLTSTAAILWAVYGALTLLQIVLLWPVTGLYQAITHAFTTMATGGFSTLGASVAGFKSPYVEWVIITFMFLAGANFALHAWALIKGRFSIYMKNSEFVAYTMFTLIVASVIAYVIQHTTVSPFRDSLFQTVSLMTTTGFASADFELWGVSGGTAALAPFLIVLVMFVGGCAGSTGGGPKVMRWMLLVKKAWRELFLQIHPKAVRPIHFQGQVVSERVMAQVSSFIIIYLTLFTVGTGIVAAAGYGLDTATTATISSLGNIGPGLGAVGPMDNYHHFPPFVKWTLSLLMIFGRLEVVTLLVILTPEYWRR